MPHVDYKLRRQNLTQAILREVAQIPITPLLIVIHYPQHEVWLTTQPPAYYYFDHGNAKPIPRLEAEKVQRAAKIVFLPDGESVWME